MTTLTHIGQLVSNIMLFKLCFKGRKYSATDSFSLKLYGSHRAYHLDGSEEEGLIRWLLSPERQQV